MCGHGVVAVRSFAVPFAGGAGPALQAKVNTSMLLDGEHERHAAAYRAFGTMPRGSLPRHIDRRCSKVR